MKRCKKMALKKAMAQILPAMKKTKTIVLVIWIRKTRKSKARMR
jgi:hypothetical protein